MSKYNHVNPGHYKNAGREVNGRDINHHLEKPKLTEAENPEQIVKPPRRRPAQMGKQKSTTSPAAPKNTPKGKG